MIPAATELLRYGHTAAIVVGLACAAGIRVAAAAPATHDIQGAPLSVVGEYINAVPVPLAQQEFAPLFAAGQTIAATLSFDTNQPDVDPSPDTGTYRIGALAAAIPQLGLAASRTSNSMQISVFDNCPVCDQFFAYTTGVDSFVNTVGLPSPIAFSLLLFGDASMLAGDALPIAALNWNRGNLSFDFMASDQTVRQVLLSFDPAPVPEPAAALLTLLGLVAMGLRRGLAGPQSP